MTRSFTKTCKALAVSAMFLAATAAQSAEEYTIDAFAPWEGRGQLYPVGSETAQFVGAFSGSLYIVNDSALRSGGNFICPATMEFNLATAQLSGAGRCVIAAGPEERIYATWNCKGELGNGCEGTFTLTEGTGSWEGVTGQGPFTAQTDVHTLAASAGNVVSQSSQGVMLWRGFTYRLP